MKYIASFFLYTCLTLSLFSQTPEKISYQAIVRSADNNLVVDSNVSLKILIRQGSTSGTVVYEENHTVTTNTSGLISIEIGTGNILQGSFTTINWEEGDHFVETQVDITGGSNYNITSISQLLSVPYALHAKTAENIIGPIEAVPYRAQVIPLTTQRTITTNDVNNTIACTSTATLTISVNFSDMAVGDTVNLEAHNGAILTVNASTGVTLNYTNGGSAQFISDANNVKFGLLRKSGENAYIISGQ